MLSKEEYALEQFSNEIICSFPRFSNLINEFSRVFFNNSIKISLFISLDLDDIFSFFCSSCEDIILIYNIK